MCSQDSDDEVDPDADKWFEGSQAQLSPISTQQDATGTKDVCRGVRELCVQVYGCMCVQAYVELSSYLALSALGMRVKFK